MLYIRIPVILTSTVSSTLITPGCRNVRSFLTAFLAKGNRDLFAVTSKENILQLEPSSYNFISYLFSTRIMSRVLFWCHCITSIWTALYQPDPQMYKEMGDPSISQKRLQILRNPLKFRNEIKGIYYFIIEREVDSFA